MNGEYNKSEKDENDVHRNEMTVLKAGMTVAKSRPRNHLRKAR
jgi:hypothetical protein